MIETSHLHFSEFQDVSQCMLNGYARFTEMGLPGQTVALAMLDATVNLYQLFDMHDDLPDLLRAVALRIESGEQTSFRAAS